jgi:hypothetical protein
LNGAFHRLSITFPTQTQNRSSRRVNDRSRRDLNLLMDTLAPTIPPIIPAEPVAATPWTRSRFRVDEPIDPAKVSRRGYGSLLLYYREAVFDKIHRSEKLDEMIRYYAQHSIGFAALFGALLGFFTFNLQIISGAIKIPLLLWGTLGICLPALFTFNVLLGSKLSLKQTAAVLSMSTYLLSTVMASLSPILLLFAISSREKSFVILLCVLSCATAGIFGVSLLWNAMGYLTVRSGYEYDAKIVRAWTLIYIFVGTQLAWILRPFIGDPGQFAWLRHVGGNFYTGTYHILLDFLR